MNTEPTRIISALNIAIGATLVVLSLIFEWSGELVAGLTAAFTAWVFVAGEIIRSKVTPTTEVLVRKDGAIP